ncbi:hypothetical protein [Nocardia sp. NPDC051570]|uniref:hypothetical protein n=1 Tax=Nocardia sp. NPDC051570 TaxID=3364324 RepID=UPI0037A1BEE8
MASATTVTSSDQRGSADTLLADAHRLVEPVLREAVQSLLEPSGARARWAHCRQERIW